jgi:hypothetical protein
VTILPSAPIERNLTPSAPPAEPVELVIPQPSTAGAWVGAGLVAATGLTGLVAYLRRGRAEEQD